MDVMVLFVTILAWIFALSNVFLIVLKIIRAMNYTELDKLTDDVLKGRHLIFPIGRNLVILSICVAWLLARWLT